MKKVTTILSAAAVAFATATSHAQQFQYANADLILDFSRSGSSDLEIDIGSLANLQSQAQAGGGTVQLNAYNVSTQLLSTFGNVNSLAFSVFGTVASSSPSSVINYATLARSNPAIQNNPPNDFTLSGTSTLSSAIKGVIGVGSVTGILPWSANNPADPAANTASAVIIPTSGAEAANSYTTKSSGITGLTGPIANTTPASFSSGGSIVSDLFEYDPLGGTHKSVFQGDFTFNSNGTLDFATEFVPAPEPRLSSVVAAAALLGLTLRHKLRRVQA